MEINMNYDISNIYQLVIFYRTNIYQYRLSTGRKYFYSKQKIEEIKDQTIFSLNSLNENKFNGVYFKNEYIEKIIELLKEFYLDNYKRKKIIIPNTDTKIRIWKRNKMSYLKINSKTFNIPLNDFTIFINFWISYNEYRQYNIKMGKTSESL